VQAKVCDDKAMVCWSVKAARAVLTVPAVVCAASVNTALTATTWMARVHAHLAGKVLTVNNLVKPATTDPTASTGEPQRGVFVVLCS